MTKDSVSLPKKILVAVEGSEPSLKEASLKAARYALNVAVASRAEMIGLCVVQVPEYLEEHTHALLRDELFGKSKKTLDEIRRLASRSKVRFNGTTIETSGGIATAVCEFSDEQGVDLIVLGTRTNVSTLTKVMLGSVASGVMSNAGCPVLVVR